MFMDIRHIRSGSVSFTESRLLRFSLAPTPEFKPDIPDVKIDLGAVDKPIKNVEDVKPQTDKLVTDASSALKGAGEKISALADQGVKFAGEQIGKFNDFMGKLKLPPKPAAEADVNADKQVPADEKPAGEQVDNGEPNVQKPDAPAPEKPADEKPAAEAPPVAPEKGDEKPAERTAETIATDIQNTFAAEIKGLSDAGDLDKDAATTKASLAKLNSLVAEHVKAGGDAAALAKSLIDGAGDLFSHDKEKITTPITLSFDAGANSFNIVAKGEKAPETEKKEPTTHRELLQRELDNANAIMRDPKSKGVDKLMAGIQALGALKQMMDRAFKGTLDEPLGKKEDPAAAAKDGAKENADAGKDGSKEKDAGKDGDKEKGNVEKDRDTDPETKEKREQSPKDRRERLREEMKEKKGGHKELLEEKKEKINASKETIAKIDEKIDGLEERHDKLDDEQDEDRKKLRNLEQELRGAEEGDKGDLEEQIADLKEDMEMRDKEMKVLDENRQTLLDRKERKQPKALEKDVKELDAMRADKEAEIKTLNETVQAIADALRSAADATPEMLEFAKILDDEEHTLDEKDLAAVASKEADAAVIEFAKSMDYELPKDWQTNTTVFAEAMEGLAKVVLEKSTKKPKPEEKAEEPKGEKDAGEGKDAEAAPAPSKEKNDESPKRSQDEITQDFESVKDRIDKNVNNVTYIGSDQMKVDLADLSKLHEENIVAGYKGEGLRIDDVYNLMDENFKYYSLQFNYKAKSYEFVPAPELDELPKKEDGKDEAPDLNKEDAEKFSKWAKAIEDKSNELGYAVTVTAGKDGAMTMTPKDGAADAPKMLETLSAFARARGMDPTVVDGSLSINVQVKDDEKGYFGTPDKEFIKAFELKAGDALEAAAKNEKPAERGTPNPNQVDGTSDNQNPKV